MRRITVMAITAALIVAFVIAPAASYEGWQDPEHNFNPQNCNGTGEHASNNVRPNDTGQGEADPTVGIGCPWLDD